MGAGGSEPVITDYGIHWGDSGEAHDLALIKKLLALFKMLHLDEFNPDLASPSMTASEKVGLHGRAWHGMALHGFAWLCMALRWIVCYPPAFT